MRVACEYVMRELLPGIKAIMAKKMMDDYGLSQVRTASLLEVTQPAISQYKRHLRGKKFESVTGDPNIISFIDELTRKLVKGDIDADEAGHEFCLVCRELQKHNLLPEGLHCSPPTGNV